MPSRRATAACAAFMFGTAIAAAAPDQSRPGEMTKAEVWVRNQGSEAIPVDLHGVHLDSPLRVVVVNADGDASVPPVRVRIMPSTWEYHTVTVARGVDPAPALAKLGLEGWDTTGLSWPSLDGTMLLLKRPR